MRTHRAGRALATALATGLVAAATVAGMPATAGAGTAPPGSVTAAPSPVSVTAAPCPLLPLPSADLGAVAGAVDIPGAVHVVADQSTGQIVEQSVSLYQGPTLFATVGWSGPPGPDKWVDFYPNVTGHYHVTLTVTDCWGRTDSDTQDVIVFDVMPPPPSPLP